MAHQLKDIIMHFYEGGAVLDDCVAFSSASRIVVLQKDIHVLGIVSTCYEQVHIPKYIFVSPYAMDPIDFFMLWFIRRYTAAKIFIVPEIEQRRSAVDSLRRFMRNLKDYQENWDDEFMPFYLKGLSKK